MIERRIGYQDGRIGYNSGGNRPKPNGSKPPFDLNKWLQELDPGGWMNEDKPDDDVKSWLLQDFEKYNFFLKYF